MVRRTTPPHGRPLTCIIVFHRHKQQKEDQQEIMGAFACVEDGRRVVMDRSRGTGTRSFVLGLIDAINNISRRPIIPQSHSSVRPRRDTRRGHAMVQMASGNKKTTGRLLGTVVVAFSQFALLLALALTPSSVQASASPSQSPSCVQITNTAVSSSCTSGGKVTYFAFTVEGATAGTSMNAVSLCLCGGACALW